MKAEDYLEDALALLREAEECIEKARSMKKGYASSFYLDSAVLNAKGLQDTVELAKRRCLAE